APVASEGPGSPRLARLRVRPRAGAARGATASGAPGRGRGGGEPALGVRAVPRRREGARGVAMAAWTGTATAPALPARRHAAPPKPAPRRRVATRRRPLTSGVGWIVVLGVLLAGVVALNVAVLRLNMSLDRLSQEQTDLHA